MVQQRDYVDENGVVRTDIQFDGKLGEEARRQERLINDPPIKHRNAGGQAKRMPKDKNFSKFLEQPLPFRPFKFILGIVLLAMAAFAAYNAVQDGALMILKIPEAVGKEVAGFPLAIFWAISGFIGITVKFKKGPTSCAGIMSLLAAAVAFTTRDGVKYGEYYAILSLLSAIIFLISGAGGIHVDLDD